MQCPQCGLSIDAGAAFCPTCGRMRTTGQVASPVAGVPAQVVSPAAGAEHWAPGENPGAAQAADATVTPGQQLKGVALLVGVVVAELVVWVVLLQPWYVHSTRHWNRTARGDLGGFLVVGCLALSVLAVLVFSPLSTSFFASLDRNSLKDPDDCGVYRRRGPFAR